ncbi:MAG: Ig-like domain-containing protein, partial [Nevskiaceae bacterium]
GASRTVIITPVGDGYGSALITMTVTDPGSATAVDTFTLNTNGTFSYAHNGSETTSDSFTYRANDGLDSNIATVTIAITPVNDAPTISDFPNGSIN